MRRPTPSSLAYAWWTRALEHYERAGTMRKCDESGIAITDEPQPGYYRRRFVRNGPWIAGRIWLEAETDADGFLTEPELMRCEVGGKECDPYQQWSYLASHPITKEEYAFMSADKKWAEANAPDDPLSNPERAIDHIKTPLPF